MNMIRTLSRLRIPVSVALALLFAVSCDDQSTDPADEAVYASLCLSVNVTATTISTLVVEVTAPNITEPLIFNIEESGGVATGTLTILVGSDQTIEVRAFDSNGIETHRGSITIDVVEGTNPNVSITLLSLTGQPPVTASLGSFAVIVNPRVATLAWGETVQLTATVQDANGDPTGDAVTWATADPGIASVDTSGLVTGIAEGDAEIVATFNGVEGFATVTVTGSAPAPTLAYVSNEYDDTVSVIDVASNTVTATISGGFDRPSAMAITPGGDFIYIANLGSNSVSVLETARDTVVATVPVGNNPYGLAITPDGAFVYVTNLESHTVSVIETASNTEVATVDVLGYPTGIAFTPDGGKYYVGQYFRDEVSVIRTGATHLDTTVRVGNNPTNVAVTPNGAFVYVTNVYSEFVSVIETASLRVVSTIDIGFRPRAGAITPDGAFVYVCWHASASLDSMAVIATASNTVVATVPVGEGPNCVAITPDGAFAYVTNETRVPGTVSVIETATNTLVTTISVGNRPRFVVFKP